MLWCRIVGVQCEGWSEGETKGLDDRRVKRRGHVKRRDANDAFRLSIRYLVIKLE